MMAALPRGAASDAVEPISVDGYLFHHLSAYAEFQFLELVCQEIAVDKVYWWCAISCCLLSGVSSEPPSRYQQTLVAPSCHGTSEVANGTSGDASAVALALKEDRETNQAAHPYDAVAVDTSIS